MEPNEAKMLLQFSSHSKQREERMPAAELTENALSRESKHQLSRLAHSIQNSTNPCLPGQAVLTP